MRKIKVSVIGAIFVVFAFSAHSFACERGCTPGFWKNHPDAFPEINGQQISLYTSLGEVTTMSTSMTFDEALNMKGGGLAALYRHTAAALLNEMTWGCFNEDFASDGVATLVDKAALSNLESLKDMLDEQNNGECFDD